ncbi:MAG: T9SS type A sorting domain-containing protein [Bacteroidales bacterium]|nr:T9SS type A sorting domain-containing protein [Bacteroidales bacterium]
MRKLITNVFKALSLIALVFGFSTLKAQTTAPSAETDFLLTIQNVVQTAPNVFEFEIYLLDADPSQDMQLATVQEGINFNLGILNSGAITATMTTIVPGFSDLPAAMQPISVSTITNTTVGLIRVAGRAAPGAGNGYIVSKVAPGTRITKLRFTNAVPFTASSTPDMVFTSSAAINPSYATRVAIYIGTVNTQLVVTPNVNANVLENPVLNPPVPLAFNVTGTGSYCQGGLGTPVGLSGSQTGVTYTLYKDAVAQVPTVDGTGAAITFGNQTVGTYTVEGTNGAGTTPMTGSAVITEDTPVAVSVTASPDQNNVCQGTSVTFTAMPTNGGTPSYQWYLNSAAVGTNQATYTYTPANNDEVYVIMTSSLGCTTGNPATSASTTMTVIPSVPVSVAIAPDQNNVCAGTSVTFTATPTNGGSPSYQWYLNGSTTGADQDTYTFTPANGDQVYVIMTSSLGGCLTGNPATSATTTMIVNYNPVSVTIAPDANPVCSGSDVTFTATPVNGGTASYAWYLNGSPAGLDQATYTFTPTNGDQVYVILTSDLTCTGSTNPATSLTTTVTVNAPVAVSVTASPDLNNVCAGTSVTFTATPTNGGTASYQWYLNGAMTGTNSPTYTFAPANNDEVYVVMTSSLTCVTGNPATSGTTTMVVNPLIPVSVTAVVDLNNVCQGTSVTFTATPVNGGTTPSYQWYRNGTPAGTNSDTYTFVPNNNDQVYVIMTSNLGGCIAGSPATSNTTTMAVYPPLVASVTAAPDQNNICAGTSVTFTATPANGGTTPSYQWYLNAAPAGTNSATYTFVPNNGDQVYVVMTSSISVCISGTPATSNTTTMVVNPLLPVSVTAAPDQNNVCQGTSVTFTATPVNGGTPSYQWYRNGSPAGANQATYTLVPNNGDQVYVTMTSSLTCISGSPATSATTTLVVNPLLPVSVTIAPDQNNICQGTSVTLTATPVNGGGTPAYQWYLNGNAAGTNSATYTYVPSNGDQVHVVLTSSLTTCVTGSPATSNSVTMVTYPGAAATVTIVAGSNDVCEGTEVVFTSFTNVGGNLTYQWKVNGVNAGTNSFQFSYVPEDGDEVLVVMTTDLLCISNNPATSNTIEMIVNPVVEVEATIETEDNGVCFGEMMYFTANTANGGSDPDYQWTVNGVNAGDNSDEFSYVPENSDEVRLIFTSSLFCAINNPAASNIIEAMVYDLPVVTWAFQDTVCVNLGPVELLGGTPEGGVYSGPGVTDNVFDPESVGTGEYTLTYTYTTEDGCIGEAEQMVIVDLCDNVSSITPNSSSVVIYPNPANDRLFVRINNPAVPNTIRLYNTTGILMFEANEMAKVSQNGISVGQFSPGTYTLQLIFSNGIVNKVFIVK